MNETSQKDYVRWLFLVFTLLVLCFPIVSDALSLPKYEPGFSIAQVVDDSELVVLGRVVEMQFVDSDTGVFTTDITVKVDELIKGTPNAGANRAKFMIAGGGGTDPLTGKKIIMGSPGTPEFAMDEEVLLFLSDSRYYNAYALFYFYYGKRKVKDDQVVIYYTLDNGQQKAIKMPVDLVVQLGKAAYKDKDATSRLEDHIRVSIQMQLGIHGILHLIRQDKHQCRTGIVLPENLVDRLKREAKQIIERN